MTDKRFSGGKWRITVLGLDLIFAVLCLIAKIMLYQSLVRDSVDRKYYERFSEELEDLE